MVPEGVKCRFGCFLKGENGVLLLRHGSSPILLPEKKFAGIQPPKLDAFGHHNAFLEAILSGDRTCLLSPVDFAAPMTESILLGNVAMQNSPGWLEWDAKKAQVTNDKAANDNIHRTYRAGWKIMGA